MPPTTTKREPLSGYFVAPASMPDAQQALLMAALADGTSSIEGPLLAKPAAFPGFGSLGLADRGARTDIDSGRPLSMPA